MENRNPTDVSIPSGLEVESARLHVPEVDFALPPAGGERKPSLKEKVSGAVANLKPKLQGRLAQTQGRVRTGVVRAQGDLRSHPAKWAGIAAGAGLLLGVGGRYLRHRAHMRRSVPSLLIIEAAC